MNNLQNNKKLFFKEDIKNQINNILNDITNEELNLTLKYHLNTEAYKNYYDKNYYDKNSKDIFSLEEKEKLDKLYLKKIEKVKDEFPIDKKNIKVLISMVSLAPVLDKRLPILELPIEKSLRVFNQVKKIYLIYSSESKTRYIDLKNKIEENYYPVTVIGKEIENDITQIYDYLKKLYRNNSKEINSQTTLLDLTNGMKLSSIAIYKFSVEKMIKVINWVEKQLPKYKEETENSFSELEYSDRIPFSVNLEIMKEPIIETRKSQKNLNIALELQEYNIVKNYYEILGEEDRTFFFEQLNDLINFETMLSLEPETFYKKTKEFIKKIFTYKKFTLTTKERIKDFLKILIILAFYKKDDDLLIDNNIWKINEDYKSLELEKMNINVYDFVTKDLESFRYLKNNNFKNDIYYYLVIKFLENRMKNKESLKKIIDFLKTNIYIQLNFKNCKTLTELKNALIRKLDREEISKYLSYLDIEKKFINEIVSDIKLKNGVLRIEKFDINIDLKKDKNIKKIFFTQNTEKESKKKFIVIFREVLKNPSYKLEKNFFMSFLTKKGEIADETTQKNEFNKFSSDINKFNKYISKILQDEKKIKVGKFFILNRSKYLRDSQNSKKEKPLSEILKAYPIEINIEFY